MNCLRIVVGGTGTNVGKTTVAAAVIRQLSKDFRVVGLKPIESGCVEGFGGDAAELAQAADFDVAPLYALREPVSPHRAAECEHVQVDLPRVCDWVAKSEHSALAQISVVETAGGLCSPLRVSGAVLETNLDLTAGLDPDLFVLVAADRLGALHDVEVARSAARAAFRVPDAVVLTQAFAPRIETANLQNAAELRRWCSELVLHSYDGLRPLCELVRSRLSDGS